MSARRLALPKSARLKYTPEKGRAYVQDLTGVGASGHDIEVVTPDLERKLLDLITDLEEFRRERWFSRQLNIFEAAGLSNQETKHSKFLAFLLTPQENHGLSDAFLKRVVQKIVDKSDNTPFGALKVALADFSDALVDPEWRSIDIFVESKNNELALAIENKIGATERENQLEHYEQVLELEFPKHARLFSFLTVDGKPASRNAWSPISYSDLMESLQEATRYRSQQLTAEAKLVIDHYIDFIRRNIVPEQSLIDQCRKLYARHRDVLSLIFKYGDVDEFSTAANNFFDNHPDLKKFDIRPKRAAFLPAQLLDLVPPIEGTNWWGQSRPLAFWFNSYDDRFGIVIEVGPFENERYSREDLVKKLQEHFNSKSKIYPRFTRVYTRYVRLTEDQLSDAEALLSRMENLYKEAADKHLKFLVLIMSEFFGK